MFGSRFGGNPAEDLLWSPSVWDVSPTGPRLLHRSQTGALRLHIPGHIRILSFYMEFAFGAAEESALHDLDLTLIG